MVPMTFIWWIYHFWARFWPYFNFMDFRAFFGPFSLVKRDRQKMADLLMKMASNQKMQENKPTLKFNFTIEKRWPVSIFELFGPQHLSHWALIISLIRVGAQGEEEGDGFVRCVQSSSHQGCSPIFEVRLQGVMINSMLLKNIRSMTQK